MDNYSQRYGVVIWLSASLAHFEKYLEMVCRPTFSSQFSEIQLNVVSAFVVSPMFYVVVMCDSGECVSCYVLHLLVGKQAELSMYFIIFPSYIRFSNPV